MSDYEILMISPKTNETRNFIRQKKKKKNFNNREIFTNSGKHNPL